MHPEIRHFKGITNTPAQLYALEAHIELFKNGLVDGTTNPPAWDDNAIMAFWENAPVGILTWAKSDWCKTISVRLGWISGGFRRQGIYTLLWKELIQIAQKEKVLLIDGATSVHNKSMQDVMDKFNRKAVSIQYRFIVPEMDGPIDYDSIPF